MTDETNPDELPLTTAESIAAAAYHAPPDVVPRDTMWAAISARRSGAATATAVAAPTASTAPTDRTASAMSAAPPIHVLHTTRRALRRIPRWAAAMSAAAALVVAVAVAVSRRTALPVAAVATPADSAATSTAWQVASAEHFGVAESMLTMLANSPAQQGDAQLTAWSRDLLGSTRLLIDSPAGRDPKRRALLLELELLLVQLVESGPAMRTEDRTMMDNLLSQSSLLLTRIRTTVPAGMPASHAQ